MVVNSKLFRFMILEFHMQSKLVKEKVIIRVLSYPSSGQKQSCSKQTRSMVQGAHISHSQN